MGILTRPHFASDQVAKWSICEREYTEKDKEEQDQITVKDRRVLAYREILLSHLCRKPVNFLLRIAEYHCLRYRKRIVPVISFILSFSIGILGLP